MGDMKHTPEPWFRENFRQPHQIEDWRNFRATKVISAEDFDRAAECVNACVGMHKPVDDVAGIRAEIAQLREALVGLNKAIDAMWNDRTQRPSERHMKAITSAQMKSAEALKGGPK